ncbi:hypothetical protein ACWGNE_02315 [Streptomyces xiamenensis]
MSKLTDLRNKVLGRPEDVAASKAADAALHANSRREQKAGIDWETDEFLELNAAACKAAKKLPRWRGGHR